MIATSVIRVQLVDDHEVVRTGFKFLLEKEGDVQVVSESSTGRAAYIDYIAYHPDILILDISLPDMSGLEAMRRILTKDQQAKVIVLSMYSGAVAERALQMGARGFVSKSSGARTLMLAIEQVMRGRRYLDAETGLQLPINEAKHDKPLHPVLTKRELEVCMLLVEGQTVSAIAEALFLSSKTVYTHREHIMDKLGATTSTELAQIAARMGIISHK